MKPSGITIWKITVSSASAKGTHRVDRYSLGDVVLCQWDDLTEDSCKGVRI